MEKRVKFVTLGCKTNIYESDAMAKLFIEEGYSITEDKADVYVINTCTVTGTGAQKSRQAISRAVRENPDAVVAVVGCLAQTESETVSQIEGVDIVCGNKGKGDILRLVREALLSKKQIVACGDIMAEDSFEEIALTSEQSRIRANVKIEDGCNNYCSYCIIPYARGKVRSRNIEKIEEEVKILAEKGYFEIVLTGIHIGSYGKDLNNGLTLIDVIERVCGVEGIRRVRLGSLEPVVITEDFVKRAKKLKNLCPHFHMSLQSGCDETLKRMNRHYTAEEFKNAVKLLRENIPNTAITTDVIVGFPGETEEEFEKSYEFCRQIGFMQMHIFKYSSRKGTRAEKFPNQIPKKIKEERSRKLLSLAENMQKAFYMSYEGAETEVLAEQLKGDFYHCTTANYMDIYVKSDRDISGEIIIVKLDGKGHGEIKK
ncbi:MAG: tRNA (N(6)-L-threonylcarbamoyladenosine(37)-C(2))-methylthiotransferase MtaB [Ruminococcaceae bacterium]|nr:tRNA (N(6)-L-threonylcarbamoyladenosine(37)-C(2))-methylthiotransferase MtaB [Oscillospiraceae bacterium]